LDGRAAREVGVTAYALAQDLLRPVLRVAMPWAMRVHAPGGTVHVVARCNNRECSFTTPADFAVLLAHLRALVRTYDGTLYAYTRMSNHVPLVLQAPNPLTTFHPSYLGFSPYPAVRQRQYRALLAPSPDPTADARDARWSTQRAVGTGAFVARCTPRRGRRRLVSVPPQIQALGEQKVSGTFLRTWSS